MGAHELDVDCVIFGGGAAGLFTLAALRARGLSAMVLERAALGAGQTRCAQGIIHGGTKYSLPGRLGAGARAIADMPERWLEMAEGRAAPSLAGARVRSRHCWLWRSDGLKGRLGMLGAKLALRTRPESVAAEERPECLRTMPGSVLRLPEPVFDPCSLLDALASTHGGFIRHGRDESLEVLDASERVRLRIDSAGTPLELRARCAILAAGAGNESLRERFGRPGGMTQRRPLHQVLVRSPSLPWLDGHCVDGDETRVTITSDHDSAGRVVWQIGGRLAEEGVALDAPALLRRAAEEIRAVLPSVQLDGAEFAAYRIDRAEARAGGKRPEDVSLIREGPVISLWPTKLALAPRAAEMAADAVAAVGAPIGAAADSAIRAFGNAGPTSAPPPWHDALEWRPRH